MSADKTKILLVTGGSRGIGAAACCLAAREGYDVAINYRADEEAARAVANDVEAAGQRAILVQGDVGVEADILNIFRETKAQLGLIDGLVNNAGIVDMPARVADISAKRLERMFRINITGSFLCAREAVRQMSTKHGGKGGSIINLTSAAATLGSPNQYVDYAASKGAIDTFTTGLALEVAEEGIRVNAVRPGIIDTDIHASGGIPDRVEQMRGVVPMKREGSAEEVAEAIIWLLSDAASYCTGTTIDVTGGR